MTGAQRTDAHHGRGPAASPRTARDQDVTAGYLEAGGGTLCLLHTPARADPRAIGVVLVPPFGWEEVASYRARRLWADDLATAGHVTLRLDLPGTGDSAGGPSDQNRLGAWTTAVTEAAGRLKDEPGVARVAVIGLGLGGLIAALAVARGAPIDDLALWAAPTTGRAAVRRQRALGRLQSNQALLPGEVAAVLPKGWIEVSGFLLSPELLAALEGVDLTALDLSRLDRALLVGADGQRADAGVRERLQADGVRVAEAPISHEYAAMVDQPGQVEVPWATAAVIAEWLAAETATSTLPAAPVAWHEALNVGDGPAAVREQPLWLDRPHGRLFAVLSTPAVAAMAPPPVCAVLLNAGAVRRSGPNRMWVEAARRWAGQGVATLRIDLPAIGDSDGDSGTLRRSETMYDPSISDDVRAAIDQLTDRGLGAQVVVGGLCTGAYRAFHAALGDQRVGAVALLNPRALIWNAELLPRREANKLRLRNLAKPSQWGRLIRGELPLGTIWRSLGARRRLLTTRLRRAGATPPAQQQLKLETALDDLGRTEVTVLVGFSGNEPLSDELRGEGLLDAADRWPTVSAVVLPSNDHELRPVAAQRAAHALLDQALAAGRRRGEVAAYSSS